MQHDLLPMGDRDKAIDALVRHVMSGSDFLLPAAEASDAYWPFDDLGSEARTAEATYAKTPSMGNWQQFIYKLTLFRDLNYGTIGRHGLRNHGLQDAIVRQSMAYAIFRQK
jgi:hypothetical protein